MGHYDECYESTRLYEKEKRREELLKEIPTLLETMDNRELEFIYKIMKNVDDYWTFFAILQSRKS